MRPPQVKLCYQAASAGDLEGVKEQFRQLFDSSKVPSVLEMPHPAWLYDSLSIAIQRNHVEIVQYLLDRNVHDEDLPAELAVRARAFDILELFLKCGWDVNKPMGPNEPPILGYDLQSLTTSDTYLPLSSIPLSTSDAEITAWLLDHGADPNRRCDWDLTPTSYAMREAPFDMIEYLFSRGADVSSGQLLHHAVLRKNIATIERRILTVSHMVLGLHFIERQSVERWELLNTCCQWVLMLENWIAKDICHVFGQSKGAM
jgi:hypothetical protein